MTPNNPTPFDNVQATDEQKAEMDNLRELYNVVYASLALIPDGRYKSMALTHLEESAMFANKSIVRAQ